MIVADIMTTHVHWCLASDTLDRPARLMWEHDCGAIPIVDGRGHVIGMVTDRDICMAAHFQGKALNEVPVTVTGCARIHSVGPDASIAYACEVMKTHRVRRLPVLDRGGNLVGILSLADIVRHSRRSQDPQDDLDVERVGSTLTEVYRPHASRPATIEVAA
jgi:CBS domain-containing protein